MFAAENIADPSLAAGRTQVPVGTVPINRATVIRDGHFEAVWALVISPAGNTLRTVDIVGNPQFVTQTQLGTRQQFDSSIDITNRDIETDFRPDIVRSPL